MKAVPVCRTTDTRVKQLEDERMRQIYAEKRKLSHVRPAEEIIAFQKNELLPK